MRGGVRSTRSLIANLARPHRWNAAHSEPRADRDRSFRLARPGQRPARQSFGGVWAHGRGYVAPHPEDACDRRRAVPRGTGAAPASKTLTHRTRRESRRLERVAASQARISRKLSRGGIASWRSGGARALNRVARAARGLRSGPWSPREELACLEELEVHGPAFFKAGVCFTEAKVRCDFVKIQEAVVTRDIWQIKDYVRELFGIRGERLCTATSPAERRNIVTRKLAAAVAACAKPSQ